MSLKIFNCPRCGQDVEEFPSICRVDNETEICSDCGRQQALIMVAPMSLSSQGMSYQEMIDLVFRKSNEFHKFDKSKPLSTS